MTDDYRINVQVTKIIIFINDSRYDDPLCVIIGFVSDLLSAEEIAAGFRG